MTHFTLLLLAVSLCAAVVSPACSQKPADLDFKKLADEMELHLERHILSPWYPRSVDKQHGGFVENYDEEWKPTGSQTQRSIVYQSRLTWVAAEVAKRYPKKTSEYRAYALHGVKALRDQMWDKEKGGFYWQVDAMVGRPTTESGEKHAYGNSFGIYAAANVYLATKDAGSLVLAKKAFTWLDEHAHDAANGGYYEALSRDGTPILTAPAPGRKDFIGTTYGQKSMNSHIHLLEALCELHKAWPDALVKKRLEEVFKIVRDKVYTEPGFLNMFFKPDWTPTSNEDSYGHDIETAYLLLEAAEELGMPQDRTTGNAAQSLVYHSLQVGWDKTTGGFYDHGLANGEAAGLEKVWWTQAEGLNALLQAADVINRGSASNGSDAVHRKYVLAFKQQWDFIRDHQVDQKNGGWLTSVEADGKAHPGQSKSDMWKDPYHQGRAIMNVIERLRKLRPLASR